jgi:hypothetical protein
MGWAPQEVWRICWRCKCPAPQGNRTGTPQLASLQPSHYIDWATPPSALTDRNTAALPASIKNSSRIKPIRADSSPYNETLSTDPPLPPPSSPGAPDLRPIPPRCKQDSWITLKSIERGNSVQTEGEWQLVLNPAWNFCIPPLEFAFHTAGLCVFVALNTAN